MQLSRFCIITFLSIFFPVLILADDSISDPLEPMNRQVFAFNETFDDYIGEPAAEGYDYVIPDRVQIGLKNFFRNIRFPLQVISNLAQLNFEAAAEDTGRFLLNTTVGLGGFIDIVGGKHTRQDLGTVLAFYGVPEGPYLVIPILGPSNVRDFTGTVAGFFLEPLYLLYATDTINSDTNFTAGYTLYTIEYLNTRAQYLEIFRDMKEDSVDYYLAQQSYYLQYRRGLTGEANDDEDWFEDEEFE